MHCPDGEHEHYTRPIHVWQDCHPEHPSWRHCTSGFHSHDDSNCHVVGTVHPESECKFGWHRHSQMAASQKHHENPQSCHTNWPHSNCESDGHTHQHPHITYACPTPPTTTTTTPADPPTSLADASELATLRDLSSVDPRNVYSVEDLEQYGTFGVAPSAPQALTPQALTPQALNSSGWITAGNCTYEQHVDNPHWSDGRTAISVHGSWIERSGSSCPRYANVGTYLQAYWCNRYDCSYMTIATDSRDVRAGGGSGRRGNARNACRNSNPVGYRGAVDIDLIGQRDPFGLTYSEKFDYNCYPARTYD